MRTLDVLPFCLSVSDIADMLMFKSRNTGKTVHDLILVFAEEFNCSASDLGKELSHRALLKRQKEREEALQDLLQEKLLHDAEMYQEELKRSFEELGHESDL